MNEQLERLKWSVESLTNINESMSFLIAELEETQKAFDELDSDYVNLLKENKRYRERIAQLINYIEMTDDDMDQQVHKIHVILDKTLEDK